MDTSTITNAIRFYLIEQGLSISKAAELLGMKQQQLSALLNGRKNIGANIAQRMHEVFGFDKHFLLTGEGSLTHTPAEPVMQTASGDLNLKEMMQAFRDMLDTIKSQQETIHSQQEDLSAKRGYRSDLSQASGLLKSNH